MKHTLKITFIIIFLFLLSQLISLSIVNFYTQEKTPVIKEGKVVDYNITYKPMPSVGGTRIVQQAEIGKKELGFLPIIIVLIIGTIILLLLIKYRGFKLWRLWYFFAVLICLFIAFYPLLSYIVSFFGIPTSRASLINFTRYANLLGTGGFILALIIAYLKVYKKNLIIHNLSELFLYPGLVIIILPIFNIISISILLILISIYDIFAVWKSKHMVKLAEGMLKQKNFAGLMLPYYKNKILVKEPRIKVKKRAKKGRKIKINSAILGGGDIAFPMLFNAVIYNFYGLLSLITILTSTLAISLLLLFSEKKKFYPAMPFISTGCFIGYAIIFFLL